MMELGATICLPRAPGCSFCPVARFCEARKAGTQGQLPVKSGKVQPQTIRAEMVIVQKNGKILLHRRAAGEKRMAGFWELPQPADLNGLHSVVTLGSFRHTITHHHYTLNVLSGAVPETPPGFRWWPLDRTQDIPLSTIARKAIRLLNPRTN
jgi:A/G-specific adenine glycosylase